jgi:hypothetical protein
MGTVTRCHLYQKCFRSRQGRTSRRFGASHLFTPLAGSHPVARRSPPEPERDPSIGDLPEGEFAKPRTQHHAVPKQAFRSAPLGGSRGQIRS